MAVFKVVDHIHQRAVGVGDGSCAFVFNRVFVGRIEDDSAHCVARFHRTAYQGQFASLGPVSDFWCSIGRKDGDVAGGLEQQAQLGQGRVTTT